MRAPSWTLLAICITLGTVAAENPWFCHDLDCPAYTISKSLSDDLELRSYKAGLWVSTDVKGMRYDTGLRMGFLRLFDYISGANEDGVKIEMTAPVRTLVVPGAGPFCEDHFTVSFFLPYMYQAGGEKPPVPSRSEVYVHPAPATSYYVFSYGGFSSEAKVMAYVAETLLRLTASGELFDASTFMTAGYDSPFRVFKRHNELWIPAASTAPDATRTALPVLDAAFSVTPDEVVSQEAKGATAVSRAAVATAAS